MPNKFGTLFSKLEQKFEEAKISDLNHELGKWVQGTSTAFVDNFRYVWWRTVLWEQFWNFSITGKPVVAKE